MKKVKTIVLMIFSLFIVACDNTSYHELLQKNNWQVVSSQGYAYEANFSSTTVTTSMLGFTMGQQYTVDEENKQISFYVENDNGEQEVASTYNISEVEDSEELKLTSANNETKDEYGDLTLSPLDSESTSGN